MRISLPGNSPLLFPRVMALPADPGALSLAELKGLVIELLCKVAYLGQTVATERDEIARLKGLKGRSPIKPSGMEQGTEPKPPRNRRGRDGVVPHVAVAKRAILAQCRPARSSAATRTSWSRIRC